MQPPSAMRPGALTRSFLAPLERFGAMGSLALRSAPLPPLLMMRFDRVRFLAELRDLQPPPLPRTLVPERAALVTLYARFLATEHFRLWWDDRREQAVAALSLAGCPPSADEQSEAGTVGF